MAIRDIARTVRLHFGYTLIGGDETSSWETGGRRTTVRFDLVRPDGTLLFEGFRVGLALCGSDTVDSDETFACALSGMTMREGDTDAEWFDDYTPEQLDWCRGSDCEALNFEAHLVQEGESAFFDVTDTVMPSIEELVEIAATAYLEAATGPCSQTAEALGNEAAARAVAEACDHSADDGRISVLAALADIAFDGNTDNVPTLPGSTPRLTEWQTFAAVCAGLCANTGLPLDDTCPPTDPTPPLALAPTLPPPPTVRLA